MKSPKHIFLNIKRDPENRFHYSVTDLLHTEEEGRDLGSYGLNRLIDELKEVREVIGYGGVMVMGVKIDKSLTNHSNLFLRSLDTAIKYFEDIEEIN